MDEFIESDRADKATKKFYNRVRNYLDDLLMAPPDMGCPVTERLRGRPEENKYGFIPQDQLKMILNIHDAQPDKPAQCNQFEAGTLAKLLFSKASFHNATSTDYLIEDLKINDVARNSFLGGHSTYVTSEENSLTHLRSCQRKMFITDKVKQVCDAMDSELKTQTVLSEEVEKQIEELIKVGGGNNDVLIVKGKHAIVQKRYNEAVELLDKAIRNECVNIELAKQNLSVAYLNEGLKFYTQKEYDKASDYFNESLKNNLNNESAKLHLDMIQMRMLQEKRSFGSVVHKSFQRRR